LTAYLVAYLRGAAAAPVVRLETRRTTLPLYGDDGVHLADLADDRVSAHSLGDAAAGGESATGAWTQEWREWELELVHGSPDIFPAAAESLAAAGARPAGHSSKLAKALQGTGDAPVPGPAAKKPRKPRNKGPVSDLLAAYLAAQVNEILAHDPGVRLEEPEAVHDLRSATRRARSALAAYKRLYQAGPVQHLRDELKWLGTVLGGPRDAEVMLARLRGHVAELPADTASDAMKARLEEDLGNRLDTASRKLQNALLSERYFRLLDELEGFLASPPVLAKGAAPARKAARKLVDRAAKRMRREIRKVKRMRKEDHETVLHQVRKDAKRLRHVAESVGPVYGKPAAKVAKSAHRLQKILGDFQDGVIARDLMVELAAAPELPETVASGYISLHTRQVQLAAEAEAKFWKKRKKLEKRAQGGVR
jgi:CHAD domain-containing protein